jgi:hypothetical protein
MTQVISLFQYLTSDYLGPADVLYFPANRLLGNWGKPIKPNLGYETAYRLSIRGLYLGTPVQTR